MEIFQHLSYYLGISFFINLIMFLIAFWKQTDKLTDITYSLTFIALVFLSYTNSEKSFVDLVILILVIIWAVRLGLFLMSRVSALGKDDRFDKMRPKFFSFLGFWCLQALSVFIVSLSFLLAFIAVRKIPTSIFYIGLMVAIIGLIIESLADYQKNRYKTKNRNLFMSVGLWKFIRHPNYLGEILFWVGIFLISFSYTQNYFWIAMIGPAWIILLLTKVSGIPLLEKKWEKKYGSMSSFREYQKRSWRLIPFLY